MGTSPNTLAAVMSVTPDSGLYAARSGSRAAETQSALRASGVIARRDEHLRRQLDRVTVRRKARLLRIELKTCPDVSPDVPLPTSEFTIAEILPEKYQRNSIETETTIDQIRAMIALETQPRQHKLRRPRRFSNPRLELPP